MSTKFHLVGDRDRDGFFPALRRYALALLALVGTVVAILVIVFGSTVAGIVIDAREHQALADREYAKIAAERAELVAVKQVVARFMEGGNFTPYHTVALVNASLFAGPNPRYGRAAAGMVNKGQEITIIARNESGTYFLLDTGAWINSSVIKGDFPDLAVLNR